MTISNFIALGVVLTATAAAGSEFVLQPRWIAGGSGSGVGKFGTPESVAIDSLGQVVVTDKGRMMLHVYAASDGTPRFDVGGLGSALGRFDRPNGIVVDASGRILVVEQRNRRVQIFDRDYRTLGSFGSSSTAAGGFIKPMGIALDAIGRIYITDEARADVQVFDAAGRFLWRFGLDPRLQKVESIEVHPESQRIFVCDEGRSCVNVYDLEGRYQHRFGSQGTGPGEFGNDTNAVRLDARGRIYVNDQGNARINVFAADTRFLASFRNAAGGMSSADGIALSERHNLLCVADQGNNRVLAFDLSEFGCRLDALELAAPAADVHGLTLTTDSLGLQAADSLWAEAPLWLEARTSSGNPDVIESAIVHLRSERDPGGIRIELRETSLDSDRLGGFVQLAVASDRQAARLACFDQDLVRLHLAGEPDTAFPVAPLPTPEVESLSVQGNARRLATSQPTLRWRFHDPAARRQQTSARVRLVRERDGTEIWSSGEIVGTETQWTITGAPLVPGEDYRVELRLASGRSWSLPATTALRLNTPPPVPTAPDPTPGAILARNQLTLSALVTNDADADPSRVWFEIESQPLLRSSPNVLLDARMIWTIPERVAPENALLRWRAVHDDGYQVVHGPWWTVARNQVEEPPHAPVLQSPANGVAVHDAMVVLQWKPLTDPDPGFHPTAIIEWCRSAAFETGSNPVHTMAATGSTDHTWEEPWADGALYWRVRAQDATGRTRISPVARLELRRTWSLELLARTSNWTSNPLVIGAAPGALDGDDPGDIAASSSNPLQLISIASDAIARMRDLRRPRDPGREPTVWELRIHGPPGQAGRLELTAMSTPAAWDVEVEDAGVHGFRKWPGVGAAMGIRFDATGIASLRLRLVARGATNPTQIPRDDRSAKVAGDGGTLRVHRGTRLALGGDRAAAWRAELLDVRGRRIHTMTGAAAATWIWSGVDQRGRRLARGTYFLRVKSAGPWTLQRLLWLDSPS